MALGYLGPADVGSTTTASEPSLLPDPKDHIEEQNLLHQAMMAEEDSRFVDARLALNKVLRINPESYTALRQISAIEVQAREYAKAAIHLKRMRSVRPDDAATAFSEGLVQEKLGHLRAARESLETSVRLAPNQVATRLLLGRICLRLKDRQAATSQFEAVLQLQPENVEAQLGIARISLIEGKITTLLPSLVQISTTNRSNPEVFELLAQAYRRSGRNDLAAQAEKQAISLRKH